MRTFLLTLAVADDIGAILIIALFYSGDLAPVWLLAAVAALTTSLLLRLAGRVHPLWYLPAGVLAWLFLHESGIHATLAGVALGLLTPARPVRGQPVLGWLMHRLHPWSSYLVIPLFALANGGVSLRAQDLSAAFDEPLTWAVILGLLVGKTAGVAGVSMLISWAGLGKLPSGVRSLHLLGVSSLAGIGFTVSLFVATLAFAGDAALLAQAKMGIIGGSLASALSGAAILTLAKRRKAPARRAGRSQRARRRP
jgi:NhaA family Na+:H+ antiporter